MESMSKDIERLWDIIKFRFCLADKTLYAEETFPSKLYVLNI